MRRRGGKGEGGLLMDTKAARGNEKRENGGKDRTNLWRDIQREDSSREKKKKKIEICSVPLVI